MKKKGTKMKLKNLLNVVVLLFVIGMVLAPVCLAQDDAAAAPVAPKKITLWSLIVVGGWAMWPLGLCSLAMVAFAVLNFRQVSVKKMIPPDALSQIRAAATKRDLGTMWRVSSGTDSFFTKCLAAGLRKINPDDPAESKLAMEEAIGETVGREESQVAFWINFLSLISAVSPMIGLLGTVSGMIKAFQKIGQSGMGKPELLANNIGEALITTAAGLIIAIPCLFFYFLFRNLLNRVITTSEEQFSLILDDITGTGVTHLFEESAPAAATEEETEA